MKKCFLIMGLCLSLSLPVFANPSSAPRPQGGPKKSGTNGSTKTDQTTPIAPATLLLLGLAGGFAGVKLYRGSKSDN